MTKASRGIPCDPYLLNEVNNCIIWLQVWLSKYTVHLRNNFEFLNVLEIMNTLGRFQISEMHVLHVNFARDPKYS